MEEFLEIRSFESDQLPSTSLFASHVESKNIPAASKGCIKDWKAFSKWNPAEGSLNYLQQRMETSIAEAILSRAAPIFYGDNRSHERVPLPLSTFIGLCKQHKRNMDNSRDDHVVLEKHQQSELESPCLLSGEVAPQQLYLAQLPMNTENEERVQLEMLMEDIVTPAVLESKKLAAINLWMNIAKYKSSTHDDPHHNLLCIVAGSKEVFLCPPYASPVLYPMPIYGEASNHTSIALENPDFSIYPRAEHSGEYSQKVILHAGDALFIPEGCVQANKLNLKPLMDKCQFLESQTKVYEIKAARNYQLTRSYPLTRWNKHGLITAKQAFKNVMDRYLGVKL